jgi:hypothetical protein
MAQKDPNTETSTTSSVLNFAPMELSEMGKQRLEATIAAQTELYNKLHIWSGAVGLALILTLFLHETGAAARPAPLAAPPRAS